MVVCKIKKVVYLFMIGKADSSIDSMVPCERSTRLYIKPQLYKPEHSENIGRQLTLKPYLSYFL